jgi:potassium-transporting ATPase KdpC subunit
MIAHLRSHLLLLAGSLVLCCVAYPLVIWGFAQTVAPASASGGLVTRADGRGGAMMIAQEFKDARYFHPRPSAAGFNGAASSGSNFGANNPKLRERVEGQLKDDFAGQANVPADAVTASGSGLDPHLTLASARLQVARVAEARGKTPAEIEKVLADMAFTPLSGLAGEQLVNVLEVNLRMDDRVRRN